MGWGQLGRTAANFLTLVACMTDADASPFDQQVATHRDYLLRFARLQLRNDTWAEDAVSETLLAALSKPLSFASRSQLKTWLVGILKHKVIDQLRRHAREASLTTDDAEQDLDELLFAQDGLSLIHI